MIELSEHPHRRLNLLTREWVLVSPHRTKRPWQGQMETAARPVAVTYDPSCYLCPGNSRAGGVANPNYDSTFVFDNDFAALYPDAPAVTADPGSLFQAQSTRGICRVVCFSPNHSLTVSRMSLDDMTTVVDTWCEQYQALSAIDWVRWIQIFENRGEMMGASNPHPHCQIWATEHLPVEPAKEDVSQRDHFSRHGRTLLTDYLAAELKDGSRVVSENEGFVAVVPFWAVWPFEVLVIARRPVTAMDEMTDEERIALAAILRSVTGRYDGVFQTSFPYSMGFHQRPARGAHPHWHFHAHFYPPLLRSATVRKFLVGYEMLAEPQRDITAESAADRLRSVAWDLGAL